MSSQSLPKIQLLVDDLILEYSKNNVLTEYRDINLKFTTMLTPYVGGVYDPAIFGSMFSDRCNCGNIRTPGVTCPRCGSRLLSEIDAFKRFARIESPVLFTNKYKAKFVRNMIKEDFRIKTDLQSPAFQGISWATDKIMDNCQFNYDPESNTLTITDDITDFSKCSYEGLVDIYAVHKPDRLKEFRSYLNNYILVPPLCLRAPNIRVVNKERKLENHQITVTYQNVIYCIHEYYHKVFPTVKSESAKALFRGALRRIIISSLTTLSTLQRSSKDNLARNMQSYRISNSARCVIVPDPNLTADEVLVPRHIAYEMCRDEFIKYIEDKKGVSKYDAELIYRTQFDIPEVQKMFEEYVEGDGKNTAKHVIINRQPSLYELGVYAVRMKLTNDYVLKIPQVLCVGLNADFDGDEMAYYAVPKEMNAMVTETLGPRNIFRFKKNQKPVFTPTHEMLHGLILASKVQFPENGKLERFDSLEDLKKYKKETPGFRYQTAVVLNGKKTTLGREILSDYFTKDVTAYLGGLDKNINSKNVTWLYEQLIDLPDRLERIRDIQQFALMLTTLSGSTAPRISDLYLDIEKEYLDKIRALEADEKMDARTKEIAIRDIYQKYQEVELAKVPESVRVAIEEGSRAKVSSLRDMAVQQLNVAPDGSYRVADTTIASGLSPVDYANHAIENRSTQDIKKMAVPLGGDITRQFVYLGSEYQFVKGEDVNNTGIFMMESDARGRTLLDGTKVKGNSPTKQIRVRSIIGSTLPKGQATGDMFTDLFKYKEGSRVGMSMITSLTESLTQSGLALKHGGNLYNFQKDEELHAPEDCTLRTEDKFIILVGKSGKEYKYPKCDAWTENYTPTGKYKKGEKVGINYHSVTPTYRLDSIGKLTQARLVNNKKSIYNNEKHVSDCYAVRDGVVKYELSDKGKIRVFVGDYEYYYSPDCLYLHPEGTYLKKYDRICSGTLHLGSILDKGDITYEEAFYFFRNQFNEIMDGFNPELIEFLFVLLAKRRKDGTVQYESVTKNVTGTDSFFKSLAYGYASKSFEKISHEGMDFVADPLTSVILSLITNDQLS